MNGTAVLVVLAAGFLLGLWVRGWWRGKRTRLVPVWVPFPVVSRRRRPEVLPPPRLPVVDDGTVPAQRALGTEPTAVYVPQDRDGHVLYVGITGNLDARFRQHADSKTWAQDVARVSAHWFPDRYAALAAEYALIHYLRPPNNTAPSGSCDAWTDRRPPIRVALTRWPRARSQARRLTRAAS